MKFYTSDGCGYDGMSKEVITALRTELGCSTTFITKKDYDILMESNQEKAKEI